MRKLWGYDHLAQAMHKGNPGMGRGAMARPGGRMHLWDNEAQRAACGLHRGQLVVQLVPEGVDENNWHVRIGLCRRCRAHVGVEVPR